jgi:hypothetical protein
MPPATTAGTPMRIHLLFISSPPGRARGRRCGSHDAEIALTDRMARLSI